MASIGFIGARLAYRVKGSNHFGDVSFVPNLSALMLYPSWATVLLIGAGWATAEITRKRPPIKLVFNVSQQVLAAALAALVFLFVGGQALHNDKDFQLLAHSAIVVTFMLVNSFSVAGVVALVDGRGLFRSWFEGNLSGLVYDLIAIPFIYGFSRAYIDWGVWGALALLILVVGLRTTYQSTHQLETTNRELLELFVQTVEFRDPYTSGHSQRVSRSSRIIAELLKLPKKEIERISTAALLHDVGKIHQVFGPILSKSGRLTPEERAVMELHPIKSAELVAKITDLQDLVPAVRGHHERWDGAGYPDQLAGEKIPMGARIITIADTIDAMVTDRPYRKALGEAEVREELAMHSGTQFDPAICEMLLASPQFSRIFDPSDSGHAIRLTGMFPTVRKRIRTPAAA
jgi:HD-GYP domain-containing protein (c-di-GMP phosphodiesterase class II)